MRVDAHMHFWKYDPAQFGWIDEAMAALRRDFLPAAAKPVTEAAGFDAVVAIQSRQTLEETRWLLALADEYPFIAGVVGWVDLCSPDLRAQIQVIGKHPKLVGVRHFVEDEPDDRFMLRPEFCRGIELLQELGLAYELLINARQLPAAVELAACFPNHRFVLDHLAKPEIKAGKIKEWEAGLRRLAALPNVVCKLSGLVTEADWEDWAPVQLERYIDVALDTFGPERLMVGSDWPVCTLAGDYGDVMDVFKDAIAELTEAEQEGVLGGNAARFWRLKRV